VLARIVNMRGVNLNVFTFDYDLTWAAFFLNADETVYGRYGGRGAAAADEYLSLAGLKYAMREALAAHRRGAKGEPSLPGPARRVEEYSAAARLRPKTCIHCHQVYDFRRQEKRAAGSWARDEVWVYPEPANVGLTLEVGQQNKVRAVAAMSAAARAGLRAGDTLRTFGGLRVASFADVQHALHRAAESGKLAVTWQRGGQEHAADLELAEGWRQTDISWRASMWGLQPPACVYGTDLTEEEKRARGLSAKALAFRQGTFVPPAAARAGIRANDVILGVDDRPLEMSMRQFNAYVRMTYKVGDRVTLNVLRDGKRLRVPLTLPARED
jgi:hypothetical protein